MLHDDLMYTGTSESETEFTGNAQILPLESELAFQVKEDHAVKLWRKSLNLELVLPSQKKIRKQIK